MPGKPSRCMAFEDCIAVYTDEDLVIGRQGTGPQSESLALIGFEMDDAQSVAQLGNFLEDLAGTIRARVVDCDYLKTRVVLLEQGDDRISNIFALVVARHDKRYAGRVRKLGRIIKRSLLDTLAVKEIVNRASDPDIGHEQRVIKRKVEKGENGTLERHCAGSRK